MGFWDGFKKVMQGKPVFENPEQISPERADIPAAEIAVPVRPGFDEKGEKIIPKLEIVRLNCKTSGENMQVWAHIKNEATLPVRLEYMNLIGMKRQLGNFLTPNETEQVLIYSGPTPRIKTYTRAELTYVLVNTNDYFTAQYEVEYDYESDGTYTVDELHAYSCVRDV